MTEADKAWLKELKDRTFSKWEPKDKYWIITLVETQTKHIADLKEFFDEAYKDAEYFESRLTTEGKKVKKLTKAIEDYINNLEKALADTEDKG